MTTQGHPARVFSSSFLYKPLGKGDWIRLVFLLPSCDGGEIECDLKTFSEDTCPTYEALSYVWGDPNNRSPIKCCGTTFEVTKNLESALLQLRLAEKTRLLWIDAICINQLDIKEREQQVGIMSNIYSTASRTVVWLGEAKDQVQLAFNFLSQLHVEKEAEEEDMRNGSLLRIIRKDLPLSSFGPQKLNPLHFSDKRVVALRALLKRPWFTRIWVAQEVGVAKGAIMVCGEHKIDWRILFSGYERAQTKELLVAVISVIDLEKIDSLSFAQTTKRDLGDLLIKFRQWNATDPRDKIFALRGLCDSNIHRMELAPDYGIDPANLWIAVARACIRVSGNLNIFSGCRGDGRKWPEIPSWAPDWSDERPHAQMLHYYQTTEPDSDDFRAAKDTTASFARVVARELHLMGFIVDLIAELSDSSDVPEPEYPNPAPGLMERIQMQEEERKNLHDTNEFFNQCERIALSSTGEYPTGEKHMAVYWQTLAAGQKLHGYENTEAEFEKWFARRQVDRAMVYYKINNIPLLSDYLSMSGALINRTIMPPNSFALLINALYRRKMARTRFGYLGLVPGAAEIGDYIAICKGGGRPLVIRSQGETFRIIGECYVHGMMYGERYDDEYCKVLRFI